MTTINLRLEPTSERSLVYYPGQLLKGTVELFLEREKSFRGFYVLVFGQARVHWTETRTRTSGSGKNRRTTTYTVHFEGKEVYLNSKTYLFGQSGGDTLEIPAGMHRYNFACQLPDQLPYTMDAAHGSIHYYVEAVLDIPWRFDKEIKTGFTVVRHDDLNLYPELKIGHKMEEVKTFCCLFCESGPLLIEVTLPHTGFAKGQSIPVKVDYSNKSDVDVLSTRVKLKRSIEFTSQTPHEKTRTDKEKMVEVMARGVKGGETTSFVCNLEIPGIMLQSNGRFCRILRVEYYVEIEGTVDGCHSNPELMCPIVIGSVPIRMEDQFVPGQFMPSAPDQIPYMQPSAPVQPPYMQPSAPIVDDQSKNDLPPSFEEAVKMLPSENSSFIPQVSTSNLGWNVSTPSAPAAEKS